MEEFSYGYKLLWSCKFCHWPCCKASVWWRKPSLAKSLKQLKEQSVHMAILAKGLFPYDILCKLTFQINLFCIWVKILLFEIDVNHCVFQVGPYKCEFCSLHCWALICRTKLVLQLDWQKVRTLQLRVWALTQPLGSMLNFFSVSFLLSAHFSLHLLKRKNAFLLYKSHGFMMSPHLIEEKLLTQNIPQMDKYVEKSVATP